MVRAGFARTTQKCRGMMGMGAAAGLVRHVFATRFTPTATRNIRSRHRGIGETMGKCFDCGRSYGDEHGFPDLIIEDRAWKAISPSTDDPEAGLLCPSCICKRLHDAGLETVGLFTSGPLKDAFSLGEIKIYRNTANTLRRTADGLESAANDLARVASE